MARSCCKLDATEALCKRLRKPSGGRRANGRDHDRPAERGVGPHGPDLRDPGAGLLAGPADRAPRHLMAREGRVFAMVAEHELMHQETLLYMLQRLPLEQKVRPSWVPPLVLGPGRPADKIAIPAGPATLGARFDELSFGWDN